MRGSDLRVAVLAAVGSAVLSAALAASWVWRRRADESLVNVGGASNPRRCTQRIER